MKKNKYNVIGMMSGTSLDGVDLVNVTFIKDSRWHFETKNAETIPYSDFWREKLRNAMYLDAPDLEGLNKEYATFLGDIIADFIQRKAIKNLDAVCTHGHTVFHQPEKKITLKIGNMPVIAKKIGCVLVCDFRTQDVELGGQGAPLVPIGDQLLFPEYDYCLNLGGFANISFDKNGRRIAFDVCPANIILNHYVSKLGKVYDYNGEEASKGEIHHSLLNELNQLQFYDSPPPKSLGIEWVKKELFPIIDIKKIPIRDLLRTLVEHIAIQICKVLKEDAQVLVTGGGAYHKLLMERMGVLSSAKLIVPSKVIIEFKEALIFGFLGVLKLRGEVNCLSSVTGASKNHSSGKIFNP